MNRVRCLLFDVGGSVFDWQTAIVEALGRSAGSLAPADGTSQLPTGALPTGVETSTGDVATTFATTWRRRSLVLMYDIATGRRPWAPFGEFVDVALTDTLVELSVRPIDDDTRAALLRAWSAMPAWSEVPAAIGRLRDRFFVAPHTILSLAAVAGSSKRAGIGWDAIVSCDALGVTKTNPGSYLAAARAVGFEPAQITYVAAHASDLDVVGELGFRTAYVRSRLDEYGEQPPADDEPTRFDLVARDYTDLADLLGA